MKNKYKVLQILVFQWVQALLGTDWVHLYQNHFQVWLPLLLALLQMKRVLRPNKVSKDV